MSSAKPTIFFSHSSKDREILTLLKEKLIKKTGGTLDIFLSSDGQSIPFGQNWVTKIEDSLNQAKIMFVFISPHSIDSNWIYFESGFSYSKGIEVIPVGFSGMDLGKLPPPLSLMQGFNVTSHEGLNNIIKVINTKFEFNIELSFTRMDFEQLTLMGEQKGIAFRNELSFVDKIEFELRESIGEHSRSYSALEIIENELSANNKLSGKDKRGKIYSKGMVIYLYNPDRLDTPLMVDIDPMSFQDNFHFMRKMIKEIYPKEMTVFSFKVNFQPNIQLVSTDYKVSARLENVGIQTADKENILYGFKNFQFAIEERYMMMSHEVAESWLRVEFPLDSNESLEFFDLIELLIKAKILNKKTE